MNSPYAPVFEWVNALMHLLLGLIAITSLNGFESSVRYFVSLVGHSNASNNEDIFGDLNPIAETLILISTDYTYYYIALNCPPENVTIKY